jgi:DNA polymerase III alpha subunit
MLFLTLEDETGILESVVMPEEYRRLREVVTTPGPFLAEGRVRSRQGVTYMEIKGLWPLHRRKMPYDTEKVEVQVT